MAAGGKRGAVSRRQFLARTAAASAIGWTPWTLTAARAAAERQIAGRAVMVTGTTLESTIVKTAGDGYRSLTVGPAWPIVTRDDLATPQSGREDRREGVMAMAHLTDIHVIDAQSPARVEFIDRFADSPFDSLPTVGAYRAHETLTTQVGSAMIERVNAIATGPITGLPLAAAVNTGDNLDNQQLNELDWYLAIMDGTAFAPNSGAPGVYEGVSQASDTDVHYWHPDPGTVADNYKVSFGFPEIDGLLTASISGFSPPGLNIPWYSCYGNHDGLLQGNAPTSVVFDTIATAPVKVTGSTVTAGDLQNAFDAGDPSIFAAALTSMASAARPVTPDADRRTISPVEWAQAHIASPSSTDGHGYTAEAAAAGILYYSFDLAPNVVGVCLDTVNRGGYAEGSIGRVQLDWLEGELQAVHAKHIAPDGTETTTGNGDKLVVLFSHHNVFTLENPFPDPAVPTEERVQGPEIQGLIHRFPNVILWVNGHSHINRVTPVADPIGLTPGFWEVSTAAHVDYPQQARLVEIADNRDGTLSIFGTIIEHASSAVPTADVSSVANLASISRELSCNEIQGDAAVGLGTANDLNVELLIPAPFDLSPAAVTTTSTTAATGGTTPSTGGRVLPVTGGGNGSLLAVGAGAAAAAAIAVRRRAEAAGSAD